MSKLVIKRNVNELIGKRIISATIMCYEKFDDEPSLLLIMDDNTRFYINAWYGGYTGNSMGEYSVYIDVSQKIHQEIWT